MSPLSTSGPTSTGRRTIQVISSFVGPRFAHGYRLLLTVVALAYLALEIVWSLRYGDAAFLGRDAFLWLYILALALEARFLSFPIGTITITLDTPVVVAAMFHIGPAATGLVVLLSMLIFGAWRAWRGEGPFAKAESSPERIIRYLFTPSITAFLALVLARDGGGTAIWHMVTPWAFLDMAGQVLAITAVFLVLQYTLVVIGYALEGGRLRRLMREAVAPGIGAEFALAPIAILFVWALDRTNPFPFVLLGIVYLAIADVLHRLASARARTLKTIGELEWIIKTGENVFAVLNYSQVLRQLAEAVAEQVPKATGTVAGIWDEEEDRYIVGVRGNDESFRVDPPLGAIGPLITRAVETGSPALFHAGSGADGFSLAVVPFALGEQPEGYIAVVLPHRGDHERRQPEARAADQALDALRKLASIAGIAIHNARLYRLATVDGMTGLYVRRFFDRRYAEEVSRAERYAKPLSVVIIDLDDFKNVNDTFGHQVGDRVLQGVAWAVRNDVRTEDVACRYGGDEFVVLLPETGAREAAETARRLKTRVESLRILHEGRVVTFTASMGVATFDPPRQKKVGNLVDAADQALYKAKDTPGKARVVVAD